jgi:lipopolysaccharide/colanic/teichoic acid biosynthesis glycosyltransferase
MIKTMTTRASASVDYHWIEKYRPEERFLRGRYYLKAKRLFDLVLVVGTLPFWLAIMILVYLVIWSTAPAAPAIFIQQRTGKNGKRFPMFKFRTMIPDAEKLNSQFAAVTKSGELAGPLKMVNDPRITKVGRILRKTSLDELPQLINVLRGDMSLVGPRPTSWGPVSYKLWHTQRLDVLPGITGLWQICGRGSEDFDDWLRWDIRYLERQSLTFDFVILYKTFLAVFKQRGAA